MKKPHLLGLGISILTMVLATSSLADVPAPFGGSSATGGAASTTSGGSGPGTTAGSNEDDGGCSVAFVRNTSAVAAGVIAVALAIGMARLRRYGMRH